MIIVVCPNCSSLNISLDKDEIGYFACEDCGEVFDSDEANYIDIDE